MRMTIVPLVEDSGGLADAGEGGRADGVDVDSPAVGGGGAGVSKGGGGLVNTWEGGQDGSDSEDSLDETDIDDGFFFKDHG